MSDQSFAVVLEWDDEDEVWVTLVPALNFLSTFGDTREEALEQTREAIRGYIDAARAEGIPISISGGRSELVEVTVHDI